MCTGNICRSPSAERLTAAWAATQHIAGLTLTTSSAGTRAVIGHPIHPEAERVLLTLGGDATNFAARQLTPKIAATADLVLTMTRAHRDTVLEHAPQKLNRTFTLSEAALLVGQLGAREIGDLANLRPHLGADATLDIADPIGHGPEVFDAVGAHIAALLPPVLELCRPR
ncbi:arsenate reductase/protein-tyrosine-phosphatase family protein [Mycobacterium sp. C31M]